VDSAEERITRKEGMTFYPVSVGALRGLRRPWKFARNLGKLARGVLQARRIVQEFCPDVVLATGGYVSVPLLLAARAARCPSLVYLPDMSPGLAVKFLSLFAQRVAVSFADVASYFPARKVMVSGYPVRRALYETDGESARSALGLDPEPLVVLILGGSRGAHSINQVIRDEIQSLASIAQIVHISGLGDHQELNQFRGKLGPVQARYHLFPYLYERMTDALLAADLVIARAGAATLGEFPAAGLPAILVPYPYAGQHQQANAEYLSNHGAAAIVQDEELGTRLLPVVEGLLGDPQRLSEMGAASRALAMPNAAGLVADELLSLVKGREYAAQGKDHG
jgi:UDP-N-acetylglucosamine--N-acetylmuramyl-(pentapeptide) pyrophosphoryl-undecaprenol N-acetylglucosamine transferase